MQSERALKTTLLEAIAADVPDAKLLEALHFSVKTDANGGAVAVITPFGESGN